MAIKNIAKTEIIPLQSKTVAIECKSVLRGNGMKIEKASWENEVFGIELTAENKEEDKILRRFWEGGLKVNAVTERLNNESSLELTFADLIGRIDYSYTPCYGTHGNTGKIVGECPDCHQPLYGEQ